MKDKTSKISIAEEYFHKKKKKIISENCDDDACATFSLSFFNATKLQAV